MTSIVHFVCNSFAASVRLSKYIQHSNVIQNIKFTYYMHNAYVSRVAMMDIFSCSTQSSCVKLQQNTVKNVIPCNILCMYLLLQTCITIFSLFLLWDQESVKRERKTTSDFFSFFSLSVKKSERYVTIVSMYVYILKRILWQKLRFLLRNFDYCWFIKLVSLLKNTKKQFFLSF